MEGRPYESKLDIEGELLRFPLSLAEEFHRTQQFMRHNLNDEQFFAWAQAGLSIADQAPRSWEAANEYFKASPEMAQATPFAYLMQWAQGGEALCKESPTVATAYFKASPLAVVHLKPRYIPSWVGLGRGLYKGTWKSSTLSAKFFELSPALVQLLTFQELERYVTFLDLLASHSYDVAGECLGLGQQVFHHLGPDKDAFFALATTAVEHNWRSTKALFEVAGRSLPKVDKSQRVRLLNLATRLSKSGDQNIPYFIQESAQAMAQLDPVAHAYILSLGETLLGISPQAVVEFVRSSPAVLERISVSKLESWFNEGVRIMGENSEGGLAYFKLESSRSEEVLDALSSGVELGRVKDVMRMYCCALAGSAVDIANAQELVEKNIGWVSNEKPTTEGTTVYLPVTVDRYSTKYDNFSWFKVLCTHQVAHLEFGSFEFSFKKPSILFEDLRPRLDKDAEAVPENSAPGGEETGAESRAVTDMQRFFDLFTDRKLALDIFTVIEDGRLDARVKREYQGLRKAYEMVQGDSLKERPVMESLPAREAMVELLVRLSLRQKGGIPVPGPFARQAKEIARIAKRVFSPGATVQDSAEGTIRIYAIISQIPNEKQPPEDWQDMDPDQDEGYQEPENMDQLLNQMGQPATQGSEEEKEQYESPPDVDYRGDFKPELAQLLARLKMQRQGQPGQESQRISRETLEELLRNSAELELQAEEGNVDKNARVFATNIIKEAGLTNPQNSDFGQALMMGTDDEGGPLYTNEPQTFLYNEWDFRADDYKPHWCIVREKVIAEGEPTFYIETLRNYSSMVVQIKRQFEMVVPEMFRKVRRLTDGEEYDLDAIIEAFVDARTGNSPSEKLYWRRNKIQRDVAVAFLLDMSASTAEAIDESKRLSDDWDAPDDPAEYMVWLRTRRGEGMKRSYKRIVDLEKESIVLLVNALEAIGDVYGIYGFSGYGRENVEFYVIKDILENFSDKIKRRIDRIAPLHATRMGPAIRHATAKLEVHGAKTKILFLISDGRPQDRGYSREGVEKEYAVHDTKMALIEAKRKDIIPFCLTVDKAGHDYLKTMCQDMGYEVLADIYALPHRLPQLYRKLTF